MKIIVFLIGVLLGGVLMCIIAIEGKMNNDTDKESKY